MKKEIWRNIPSYEGIFEISNFGRVKSIARNGTLGGVLRGTFTELGYHRYLLSANGVKKSFFAHRIVASVFIPNPQKYPFVNHKDENPSNNYVENLEWCDAKYNTNYGNGIKRRSESRYKKVYQFDKDGNLIKVWNSGTELSSETGYTHSRICEVANGNRKSAYGYIWSYNHTKINL